MVAQPVLGGDHPPRGDDGQRVGQRLLEDRGPQHAQGPAAHSVEDALLERLPRQGSNGARPASHRLVTRMPYNYQNHSPGGRTPPGFEDRPGIGLALAYRCVVPDLMPIVDGTPRLRRPILVGVDGVDGSGKTTLARQLSLAYAERGRKALVIHLDDLLNPKAVRYQEGRSSPEGYFLDTYDIATFTEKVLRPFALDGTRAVTPRAFDHLTDQRVHVTPVLVPLAAIVIVGGMFLHRDELHRWWDPSLFPDVPFPVSVRRMADRDGSSSDPDHLSLHRCVEGQRIYLSRCRSAQRATVVIDNS